MKKILMFCILSFPIVTISAEHCQTSSEAATVEEKLEIKTDVPNHLKGATIIIRTADGKESSVPAEKFKVVARKQQFIITKVKQLDKTVCTQDAEANKKNRVSLMGGNGPKDGLDRSSTSSTVSVESRVGAVGGAQYQRLLNDRFSVGAQIQTNKSVLLELGLDF